MLIEIAKELKHISASIDFIEESQAEEVITAVLDTVRNILKAMTVEFFYLTTDTIMESLNEYKVVPIFERFAKSLDRRTQSKSDRQFDKYDLSVLKGIWTWSYREKCDVWIDDNSNFEQQIYLPNRAVQDQNVPHEHLEFYENTKAVITIPFEHKIGYADSIGGILSIEFDRAKLYNSEEHRELKEITEYIADVFWKSSAWRASKDGTKTVIGDFKDLCIAIQNGLLPIKTGLFARTIPDQEEIIRRIEQAFRDASINMDKYDGYSDATELFPSDNITDILKKEHFGVFDVTENNTNIILILGIMLNESKPCMILANRDNVQQNMPLLIDKMAIKAVQDESRFLYLYRYETTQNGIRFIDTNGTPVEWEEAWSKFIEDVKKLSPAFRMAFDRYP